MKKLVVTRLVLVAKYAFFPTLLVTALLKDAILLFDHPVAAGFDGYYYVLQVDSLMNGASYFQTKTPLILYFLTIIRIFFLDTVLAIKVGAIFLHLLLCLAVGAVLFLGTKSHWVGAFGSIYVAVAGLHYFMITEFINNLGAVTFILLGICFGMYAAQNKKRWPYIVSSICLLISAGCHRSAVFIVGGLGIVACIAFLFFKAILERNPVAFLAFILLTLLLYFLPYFLAVQTIIDLPENFTKEFSTVPRLPITRFTMYDSVSVVWSAAIVVLMTFWHKRIPPYKNHIIFLGIAFATLLVNLNGFVNPDMILIGKIGRLQTLIYIQVGLLVPYAVWLAYKTRRVLLWYALAFFVPLLLQSSRIDLPYGLQSSYLSNRQRLIAAMPSISQQIPADSIIIAPHGDQFVVTYSTGMPAQQTSPKDSRYRSIFWMLRKVPRNYRTRMTKEVYVEIQGTSTLLVSNNDLGEYWSHIEPLIRNQILISNPHLKEFLEGTDIY
jgi:hypothetical protein